MIYVVELPETLNYQTKPLPPPIAVGFFLFLKSYSTYDRSTDKLVINYFCSLSQ